MAISPTSSSLRDRIRNREFRILTQSPELFIMSSMVHYGLRAVVGRRALRTTTQVAKEYADNRSEYWKQDISLDDLIYDDDTTKHWILRDGRPAIGTFREAREHQLGRLRDAVHELLPDGNGTVMELGCGTGRNLMYLAQQFPQMKFKGIDLMPIVVERANLVAKKEKLPVTFEVGDIRAPAKGKWQTDVTFSMHALEQLSSDFVGAADNMIEASKVGVVWMEPIRELWPVNGLGTAARLRLWNADYLRGLYPYLKSHHGITIQRAEVMTSCLNPLNLTVEIVAKRNR